jgi:hypothetical protein
MFANRRTIESFYPQPKAPLAAIAERRQIVHFRSKSLAGFVINFADRLTRRGKFCAQRFDIAAAVDGEVATLDSHLVRDENVLRRMNGLRDRAFRPKPSI